MNLKENSYKNLKEQLDKLETQFSKSDNKMLAFDLISKGEMTTQVTKVHLINIIKVLCKNLDWTEDEQMETLDNIEENQEEESPGNSSVQPGNSNVQLVRKELKNGVCKFFKSGNCKHGKSGKTPDNSGKKCSFDHPQLCKKHELFGDSDEGCKNGRNCNKLHLNLCKHFMKFQSCKYEEKCKFFHPRKIKMKIQNKERYPVEKTGEQERYRNVNYVNELLQPGNVTFLEQPNLAQRMKNQVQQNYIRNVNPQPFLGPQIKQGQMDPNHQMQMMNFFTNLEQLIIQEKNKMNQKMC